METVHEVATCRKGGEAADRKRTASDRGAQSKREPAEEQAQSRERQDRGGEPRTCEIEVCQRVEHRERKPGDRGHCDDLSADCRTACEDCVAPSHGVREDELEPHSVLLAGERTRAGSDRHHEHEQWEHEAQELDVEVAGAGGDVPAFADAEEGLEHLGVVLRQALEVW